LYHNDVFVVLVRMLCRNRGLVASPECHLTPIRTVKDVTLDAGSRLTIRGNSICRTPHELREIVHRYSLNAAIEPTRTLYTSFPGVILAPKRETFKAIGGN